MSVAAAWYDGRTSQRRDVRLYTDGGRLIVTGDGVERAARLDEVEVSERLGSAPRLLRFADGAVCEVRDHAALAPLLTALGHREGVVDRWQRSTLVIAASAIGVAAMLVLGYLFGLPWAAARVAQRLPAPVAQALSQQTLAYLDENVLEPSTLPAGRQAGLRNGFLALQRRAGSTEPIEIHFRSGAAVGPNAFALPDGTIVVFDELVALADDDGQIHGVLAHELGHVAHRHGLRLLLQASVVGLVAYWWLGDFATLAAAAPTALLQSRYSRAFETEADAYAVALLRANGLSPASLADLLERMVGAQGGEADDAARWLDYVASHPAPRARLESLRGS